MCGYIGAIHPNLRKLGINGRTFVFELELAHLGFKNYRKQKKFQNFPAHRRDIAIVCRTDE